MGDIRGEEIIEVIYIYINKRAVKDEIKEV